MNFINPPTPRSTARALHTPQDLDGREWAQRSDTEAQAALERASLVRSRRRFAWLGTAASLAIIGASIFVLFRIASGIDLAELRAAFTAASARQLGLCALFTALSYLLLTAYDAVALRQLRLAVPYRTTALASFTSYAVSFNLGFPLLTGGTVRYWIYAACGVRPGKVASLTAIAGLTFWLGMGMVLAWSLLTKPEAVAELTYTNAGLNRLIGFAAFAIVGSYLIWVSVSRRAIKIQGWRLELPGLRLSLGQILIGAGDVCAGAAALYVLLPAGHGVGYETFLAVYVVAIMLGIISHAPGGLGVFEVTVLLALSSLSQGQVLGALLLFRICYYFIPFVVALALLGAYEISNRIENARRVLTPDDSDE
jgi:glycosyltransferase 2 family protein